MSKEKFLTLRWNYIISLVQGLPTFIFVIYAFSTSFGDTQTGMIVLSVLGSLFGLFLEYHTSARFAWLQENSAETVSKPSLTRINLILLVIHNLIFWFFLIPFITPMSYRMGFAFYSIILLSRFIANTYINLRDFTLAQYYAYPFRIPGVFGFAFVVILEKRGNNSTISRIQWHLTKIGLRIIQSDLRQAFFIQSRRKTRIDLSGLLRIQFLCLGTGVLSVRFLMDKTPR